MAQEKLLFSLKLVLITALSVGVVVLMLIFTAKLGMAEERFSFKQEDLDQAHELRNVARQTSMEAIKEEYHLLQQMQNLDQIAEFEVEAGMRQYETRPGLKIFVSSSMNTDLLKSYLEQAKRYGATLILRGLPGGSWRKLSSLIYEITEGKDEGAAIQLDDMAFAEYGISSVPTFVLSKERSVFEVSGEDEPELFDKVSGNIGARRALEIIAEQGDLSDIATTILNKARRDKGQGQ